MPRPCECRRARAGGPFRRGVDCVRCWLWLNNPRSRAAWEGGPAPAAAPAAKPVPAPPCAHRGRDRVPTKVLAAAGLAPWLDYRACGHPDRPLGEYACRCKGCGPTCPGYLPARAGETSPPAGHGHPGEDLDPE